MVSAIQSFGTDANALASTGQRVVGEQELEKTFRTAVAGMFYGQLMKALRSTAGETAYLHGGQAEKMFEAQLDQQLVEDLAAGHNGSLVQELYQQFRVNLNLPRQTDSAESAQASMSPQTQQAAQLQSSLQSEQAAEAAYEARSVSQRILSTTDTTAFAGLFRK